MRGKNKYERERKLENVMVEEEARGRFKVDSKEKKKNRSKTEQRKMNEAF